MALEDNAAMFGGVKVVDLTSVVFGPYATQILADLGADVTKVESPPMGDVFRYSSKPAKSPGMSAGQIALNRGKRSVLLNLKDADDLAILRDLIADADIFIHNIRGKAIERLGLDYDAVKAIKPNIIYVHCVGFGSGGPYSGLQAYDDVIQAASGATTLLPRVDGIERPRYIPSLVADKVAGLHAAYATMAAMVHRLRTGDGQFVEVPMFEAFSSFILKEHMAGKTFDPPVGPLCYDRQIDPDRQPYPTKDGYISIVPYTNDAWDALFTALGAPEFLNDARFQTPAERTKNMDALYKGIGDYTPAKTTAEWIKILTDLPMPCMAVRDIDDILEDPHLKEVGLFQRNEHPTEGAVYELREPSHFSEWSQAEHTPAPHLGQDTKSLRGEGE